MVNGSNAGLYKVVTKIYILQPIEPENDKIQRMPFKVLIN